MDGILAPAEYWNIVTITQTALGPDRKPLLIGIDGKEGTGKRSLSCWLAWQLRIPVIHLDLFLRQVEMPARITRRVADLDRCIKARGPRPMVIEGVLLLDALDEVGRTPDFLIFVDEPVPVSPLVRQPDPADRDPREFALSNQIADYLGRRSPADCADFTVVGFSDSEVAV